MAVTPQRLQGRKWILSQHATKLPVECIVSQPHGGKDRHETGMIDHDFLAFRLDRGAGRGFSGAGPEPRMKSATIGSMANVRTGWTGLLEAYRYFPGAAIGPISPAAWR